MNEQKIYLKTLGVLGDSSSIEVIKQRYWLLAKRYHPDVNPTGEEVLKGINIAYEWLCKNYKQKKNTLINDEIRETFYRILQKKEFEKQYIVTLPDDLDTACIIWCMLLVEGKQFRLNFSIDEIKRLPLLIEVENDAVKSIIKVIHEGNECKY
jgi:hypothetical protein